MCIRFKVNGTYCDSMADLAAAIGAEAIILAGGDVEGCPTKAEMLVGKFCLCPVDQRQTFPHALWRKRRFDGCDLAVTSRPRTAP